MSGFKEHDYISELEASSRLTPARPVVMMLVLLMAFIVFFILWAAFSEIEELTRGQGMVVPSRDIQVVQSLEGGILQELLVDKGDLVKKGQVLMRLSDVEFSSEERGTEARFLSLKAKKARLVAETKNEAFVVPEEIKSKAPKIAANEEALYLSRQKELESAFAIQDEKIKKAQADLDQTKADISRLGQNHGALSKELKLTRSMVEKRAMPQIEQMRLERELGDISGQISARNKEKAGLEAQLKSAENERGVLMDKFRSQALEELGAVETDITSLNENLKSMGDRVDRREIRAPVDGIVNEISVKTIGGVIEPAMRVVEVVPVDDELKIIAKVRPDEIAFLKPGQAVKVKVTAYDPQKFGSLDGTLVRKGATSTNDKDGNVHFEIEVHTNRNFLGTEENPLPITPGMVANVEVITGKRTILHYLTKPLRRGFDRALHER